MKRLSGQRIEPEADGLTHAHIVPVTFSDTNCEIHLRWVEYLCDRASGLYLVSRPVIRQRHAAEEESSRCIHVSLDGDESVHRGDDVHAVEVLLRLVHGELRLVKFFLRKKNRGLARGMMRFNVVLQLGQNPLCLLKGKIVFLPIDFADEFVLLDIEFGAANVVSGLEKCNFVFGCLDLRVGVSFCDLLLSLEKL